jgi:hypothetical protein
MQLVRDASGARIFTLLNPHKNAIYFYDYESGTYIGDTRFEREGPNAVMSLAGYYVKNMDSIYVHDRPVTEIALTDSAGHVKQRISLRGSFANVENKRDPQWARYYPQYLIYTVTPFIEIGEKLLVTGLSPFSIPDSLIDRFRFTACVDMKTGDVEFLHTYPDELYGSGANWAYEFPTHVYPVLSPTGELIHSFPVSHDLYITEWDKPSYRKVYAGSNTAKTISSIDREQRGTPDEEVIAHYFREDLYAAILYDSWRRVYYRYLQKGISDGAPGTPVGRKPVIVIIMDEQFNYLGETLIGTGEEWKWENSFVTEEGLNIEYVDDSDTDEEFLHLKIFTVEDL